MTTALNFRSVQVLPTFPEFAAFSQQLTLGARKWTFEFEWRPRLTAWFCSVYDDEFNAVFEGRAVLAGSNMAFGVLDFPGALLVFGDKDNDQGQLGEDYFIYYVDLET